MAVYGVGKLYFLIVFKAKEMLYDWFQKKLVTLIFIVPGIYHRDPNHVVL